MLYLVLFTFAFFGCTNAPYRGKDLLGADEFIMDSYRIREGKSSILEMEGSPVSSLSSPLLEPYQDTIQEGDILNIALFHPSREDLSHSIRDISSSIGFRVANGTISLPGLAEIEIANMTLEEARKKIESAYQMHIRDVDLFITYRERTERKVELAGMVKVPSIPVDGKMRLFEALAIAAVPPNANLFKSYIVRDCQMLPVDLYKLIKEGDMQQNIVLHGGDKIYIAESSASSIMVLGEVGKEKVIDLPNGFMTLQQAIAEAGGILPSGDRSYIQVIRGNVLYPRIYTMSWRHIVRLPSTSLLVMPGDIIYVAATPIAEWNRFVSQLLPTFIGLDLVTKGIRGIGVNVP